jgi:mitogen-activated protein kinase kinase kinase
MPLLLTSNSQLITFPSSLYFPQPLAGADEALFLSPESPALSLPSEGLDEEILVRRPSLTVVRRFEASLAKEVVVKRVGFSRRYSEEQLEAEAKMMGLVSHPNLLQCFDFRTDRSRGSAELVLEAGSCSLADLIRTQPLSPGQILALFSQICSGLAALHSSGIVHGDLKAENIILVDGVAKLADFGEALLLSSCPTEAELTRIRGTPGFMAPEVIRQEGCSPASDIWSLGALLYELVSRERPFAELEPQRIMFQVAREDTKTLTEDPFFNSIISFCQARNRSDRPSAQDLLNYLLCVTP